MVVDLEGFMPGVWPKGKGSKKRDTKGNKEEAVEEQADKTKAGKPKGTFAFQTTSLSATFSRKTAEWLKVRA